MSHQLPNHNRFNSADLYQQIQRLIKHNPTILEFKLLNLMYNNLQIQVRII